jgi:hypothetical protein
VGSEMCIRDRAWDAMNALAPDIAGLSADDPQKAYDLVRDNNEYK